MMNTLSIKLISFLSLSFFSVTVLSQPSPPVPSPATVYRNIENLAIKNQVASSTKPVTLVRKDPTEKQKTLANNHLSLPGNIALMLIDKGEVVFEGYQKGPTEVNRLVSFSMGKSIMSLVVGEAYCDNKITSLDDPAEKYAPELKGKHIGKASIRQLLTMSSGAKIPSSHHGQPYYMATHNLLMRSDSMKNIIAKHDNDDNKSFLGNAWGYSNMDTDALYFVVKGATNNGFADFYKTNLVEKAGLKDTTYWGLDADGNEITHSFYFATLQDWARIGLYIRDHIKNKQQTCMGKYITEATSRQVNAKSPEFANYGYQFFVNNKTTSLNDFWMVGFGGQRIGFDMEKDKIILNFSWQPNPENSHFLLKQF